MASNPFKARIRKYVDREILFAEDVARVGDLGRAFHHLERAHILGQSVTREHTRVHWLMLKLGRQMRDRREVVGQILRIIGASTKTPFGIYPAGNTGGSNVSPTQPMPIPVDLAELIRQAKAE